MKSGERHTELSRRLLWGALGLVILAGVGVLARVAWVRVAARKAQVAEARDERQTVRVHPVPAPLPTSLPIIGPAGVDADGYPYQHVDRPALRALLAAHRFRDLTAYVEQLQAAFEADPRKEYWPIDAADTFASAESEIVPDLDAWVAETPGSFAPYLARGSHYDAAAGAQRGFEYRSQTPDDDFKAMTETAKLAVRDLDRALALRPGLVAAMRAEMRVARLTSDHDRISRMSAAAFTACPACLQVRAMYIVSLLPRWGGSYDEMDEFLSTLSERDNPRFRALRGSADFDRASGVKPKEALVPIDRALRYGEYWEYLSARGRVLRTLSRDAEALAALDRADALRSMQPAILSERAALHCNRKEYVAAGRDLLVALRTDPAEPNGKRYATDVINGLMSTAQASDAAGKRDVALEALELVLDLCPDHHAAQAFRARLLGSPTASP